MMSRLIAACLLPALVLAQAASAQPLTVETNKTAALRLNGSAASVVIGNPVVADITVFDERLIFVTGKSFGTTNLMVFDARGELIYSNDVSVVSGTQTLVRVVRAGQSQTFDCAPNCRSVLNPGDDPAYFGQVFQQNQQLSDAAED